MNLETAYILHIKAQIIAHVYTYVTNLAIFILVIFKNRQNRPKLYSRQKKKKKTGYTVFGQRNYLFIYFVF
jgi:hypothetical protein